MVSFFPARLGALKATSQCKHKNTLMPDLFRAVRVRVVSVEHYRGMKEGLKSENPSQHFKRTAMNKTTILLMTLPVVALAAFGYFKSKNDALPFKPVIAKVTAQKVKPVRAGIATYDTEVTVFITYQGPKPNWWGQFGQLPNSRIGDTYLVDENGKEYRYIKMNKWTSRSIDSGSRGGFSLWKQQYVTTHFLDSSLVPAQIQHLTFKSRLIYENKIYPFSCIVRGG